MVDPVTILTVIGISLCLLSFSLLKAGDNETEDYQGCSTCGKTINTGICDECIYHQGESSREDNHWRPIGIKK